jgi:predicted nucleic acid-binding protein
MSVLLDTNLLVRLSQASPQYHATARTAIDNLQKRGENLCIVPQVLYEFWVVCTRAVGAPSNGLGLTVDQTRNEIVRARSLFQFLPDTPAVYTEWEKLVVQHAVKSRTAHDARLVAAMLAHNITHLLTFNTSDFQRYSQIQLIDPSL